MGSEIRDLFPGRLKVCRSCGLPAGRARACEMRDEFRFTSQSPGFVENAPCKNGRVIDIALNRFPHHLFESPSSHIRIAPFTKVWKIAHEQHSHFVRIIEQQWIVNFYVDAKEVKSKTFSHGDIL